MHRVLGLSHHGGVNVVDPRPSVVIASRCLAGFCSSVTVGSQLFVGEMLKDSPRQERDVERERERAWASPPRRSSTTRLAHPSTSPFQHRCKTTSFQAAAQRRGWLFCALSEFPSPTREGPRPTHSGPWGKSALCVQGVD